MQYGDNVWETLFSTREWGKYPPEEVIRFFMRVKGMVGKEKVSVLDIGSGIGACSWFMAKEGGKVVAFDGAPSALKKINMLATEFGVVNGIETILGDITDPLTFIPKKFDILLDNYSLYANFEEKILKSIQAYFQVLNEGGYFLMNCFGKNTTGYGTGEKISENTYQNISCGVLQNRGLTTFFEREKLDSMFKSIGFKILYTEKLTEIRSDAVVEKHITCVCK